MATCKDCLHENTCQMWAVYHEAVFRWNEDVLCDFFKDKSQYAEVKRGKWIEHAEEDVRLDYLDVFYECSVCGRSCMGKLNYCPNCGADMRGNKCE